MRILIDEETRMMTIGDEEVSLYSPKAFEVLSRLWVKIGWDQKYGYSFSWLGRPIIQLPEDMIRIQELVYELQPDVIIETGVAHGGSLIFYASLIEAIGKGRIIGVDIEIRTHNRRAIEDHRLSPRITLVEGDSVAPEIVAQVESFVGKNEKVLVILDSCHSKEHVLKELYAYAPLVSRESYIVVTDGILQDLHDVPRGNSEWKWDNPVSAIHEFISKNPEFTIEQPIRRFDESMVPQNITHWPSAWLKRR